MEYYSAIEKKEKILPFAATWVDLEGSMLNKISDRRMQILYISFICRIKANKNNLIDEETNLWLGGVGGQGSKGTDIQL